jgi:hypothetical protein
MDGAKLTLRQLLLATPATQPVILRVHDTTSGLRWEVELWPIRHDTEYASPYHGDLRQRRVAMFAACDLCDTGPLLDERQAYLAGTKPVVIDNIPRTALVYEVKSNGGFGK